MFRNHSCISRMSCEPFRLSINGPKDEVLYFIKWFKEQITLKFNAISTKRYFTDNVECYNCNIDITKPKGRVKERRKGCGGYSSFREVPSSVGIKFYGTKP